VFYDTVNTTEENIKGASRLVQGVVENVTPSTIALARVYLDAVTNPRQLPVPLHYQEWAEAILDPKGWAKKRGVEID
jgi:hypothetical protein